MTADERVATSVARMLIDTFEASNGQIPQREKLIEAIAIMLISMIETIRKSERTAQ